MKELKQYSELLNDIKSRVRQGQLRVNLSANAEMLATYWDVGKMIHERQQLEGWGSSVIPRLAKDLKNELSEVKGFSERNLNNMISFYQEYSELTPITKPSVSQLRNDSNAIWQPSVAKLESGLKSISPLPVSELKNDDNKKRKLTVSQLQSNSNSILQPSVAKLGNGDFKQTLLLSTKWANHIMLIQKVKDLPTRYWYMQQCINNGWSRDTLSDMIKSKLHERQGKDKLFAEYSLKDINKPIGISEYELTRILPENLKSSLPSIEEIESELERKITMVREEIAKYGVNK